MNKTLVAAALGLCAVGCSHYPAPTDKVATSIAAVRGAEEAGASEVPQAALHVKLANEQIKQAQDLMKDDNNRRAEDKASRASDDAELAVALAREQQSQNKLKQFAQASQSAGGESTQQPQPQQTATP